jgi:5-methylcytosine-specific restriction endonuclease McrBC GTP-binding regulatory subunit McrB
MHVSREERYKIWDKFLDDFPLQRLNDMTLDEYTGVGKKDTFSWWMESGLDKLGSIWGGSAFKFGIYERKDTEKEFKSAAYKSSDRYAWLAKYGNSPGEAFSNIKKMIVDVCKAAQAGDLNAIDKIDLGNAYKWKIAFQYQDRSNPTIINIFVDKWLKAYLGTKGISSPPTSFANLNEEVMKFRGGKDLLEYGDDVWQQGIGVSSYLEFKKKFLEKYPDFRSFNNPPEAYLQNERNYKDELCKIYADEIAPKIHPQPKGPDSLQKLGVNLASLFTRKLQSGNGPQNLVGWRYFQFITNWQEKDQVDFARAVSHLVDDNEVLDIRLSTIISVLKEFTKKNPAFKITPAGSRSVATFFLFLNNPSEHFFIKTEEVNRFLAAFGLPKFANDNLSAEEYTRVKNLAEQVKEYLDKDGFEPKDMIDVQSFVWTALTDKGAAENDEAKPDELEPLPDELEEESKPDMQKHPLNQILYGPPGTGKTFHTARIAVEICDNSAPADRIELMKRYRELVRERRVSFVSFHQSFSYEEFIEGIRPNLEIKDDEVEDRLTYRIEDGLFKKMCKMAKNAMDDIKRPRSGITDLRVRRFFKMSVGGLYDPVVESYCFENNWLALGKGGDVDFSVLPNEKKWEPARDAIKSLMAEKNPDNEIKRFDIQAIYLFKNNMDIGDIVIIPKGLTQVQAIGEVTGGYEYNPDTFPGEEYMHFRKVRWLIKGAEIPYEKIQSIRFAQASIYCIDKKAINIEYLEELLRPSKESQSDDNPPESYVLIIDEINRANISKVFGELITLIEPDKRFGAINEITVKLPYSSGEEFGVPINLHIVGTMNTADRSLALMDTALRRRFEFVEMMPDYSTLEGLFVESINIKKMLEIMNKRIEALYDREHTLGHAFFIPLKENNSIKKLGAIFEHKIIPLLAEYFFEDWHKIRLVLGDNQKGENKELQFIVEEELQNNGGNLFGHFDDLSLYGLDQAKDYKRNSTALKNEKSYKSIYDISILSDNSSIGSGE